MENLLKIKTGSRRDFLHQAAGAAVSLALAHMPDTALGIFPTGSAGKITLNQCLQCSPREMAEKSAAAKTGYRFLLKMSGEIQDAGLRRVVTLLLHRPIPRFMERYQSGEAREMLRRQLVARGLLSPEVAAEQLLPPVKNLTRPPQPLVSAPGSAYFSHHAYPGGLAVHTVLNLCSSLGLCDGYYQVYGFRLKRDVLIACQLLHDLAKTWVFQWQEDHSPLPEYAIAGTGAHHVLGIAESIYRGLAAEVVIAQACVHDNIGLPEGEAKVVGYLKAAAVIAGKDPVKAGLLSPGGTTVVLRRKIECFIAHLGDHDWVVSVPAAKRTIALLQKVACIDYGMTDTDFKSTKFNIFRNYVFSQATMIGLYHIYTTTGEEGFRSAVNDLVLAV